VSADGLANSDCLPAVTARWFEGRANVAISLGLEGVDHDVGGAVLTFGCRAGPSRDVVNLLHEMAHLVEIPEARSVKPDWGFKLGKPFLGAAGIDFIPVTAKGTEREARVWAWQTVLMEALGIPGKVEDLVRGAVFMGDFPNVPGKDEGERLASVAAMVRDNAKGLTIEGFDRLWDERVACLGALFEIEAARAARLGAAFGGEEVRGRLYSFDGEDPYDRCVVLKEWSDGSHVAYEVYAELGGVMDGTGHECFESEAEADRYARSLFMEMEYRVTDLAEPVHRTFA